MLSEEEIIEYLENQDNSMKWNYQTLHAIKGLLDLYNKQKQEIENLQSINKEHQKLNGQLREEIEKHCNAREIEEKYIKENFISKDEYKKLETKYQNVERELLHRDKIIENL